MKNAQPPQRDPSFLRIAALAALGGVLAIVFSIGFPIWARHAGRPATPAFSLFACWGLAALCGAYACLRTYFQSETPAPDPPRGGVRLALISRTPMRGADDERRRAA